MGIEQVLILEKLIKRFRKKPLRTFIEIMLLAVLFGAACFFGAGYLPEKGKQFAANKSAPSFVISDFINAALNNIYVYLVLAIIILLLILFFVRQQKEKAVLKIDLNKAIKNILEYNQQMEIVRDAMNEKGRVPSKSELAAMRIAYERLVHPYIDALKLNEPGEKDYHGYLLKYDNPVDLALKEFTFFHLNLGIEFLNKISGRLQYLKAQNI